MNDDAIKALKQENKIRNRHPYWVYESVQMIPDLMQECLGSITKKNIEKIASEIQKRDISNLVFLGRGSSYFLTLALRYLYAELTDFPVSSFVTNIFEEYPIKQINKHTAVFFHSTSGNSEGDRQVVEFVKKSGAYTIGVTDIPTSILAQAVDDVFLGPGGAKIELPATRTYATALFRMSLLAVVLAKKISSDGMAEKYERILQAMPDMLRHLMPENERNIKNEIDEIKDCNAFFVLGYGPNLSTADETALALSQCAGVPATSFELENFIHGPSQTLTKEMGVVAIASEGPLQERMLRMTMACKRIGAKTIVLLPQQMEKLPYADIEIYLPNQIPDMLSPILYMIPMWQMAYQFALFGKGGHPDRLSMDKPEFKAGFEYIMKKDKWVS